MANKTQKETINEVHQAVFGVSGTEEMGMVGDIKDIKKLIKEQNNRYRKLSNKVYYLYGVAACCIGGIIWVALS